MGRDTADRSHLWPVLGAGPRHAGEARVQEAIKPLTRALEGRVSDIRLALYRPASRNSYGAFA